MSSTGRGPRLGGPDDVFPTPAWCVRRLLEHWVPRDGWLLEPGAGDGAIIKAVNATEPRQWFAVECRATCAETLKAIPGVDFEIADFTTWVPPERVMDLDRLVSTVIGNNPFALNEECIRRSRILFPRAELVFLIRLGFLAGNDRRRMWDIDQLGQPDVYVLPNRPSFTPDGGTDSADYAWIVLPPDARYDGKFQVLGTTSLDERRAGRAKKVRRKDSVVGALQKEAPSGDPDGV